MTQSDSRRMHNDMRQPAIGFKVNKATENKVHRYRSAVVSNDNVPESACYRWLEHNGLY